MSEQIAEATSLGRDLYWKIYAGSDGFVRWGGYDDKNWWDNVAHSAHARTRIGLVTGRRFIINFHTGEVDVSGE